MNCCIYQDGERTITEIIVEILINKILENKVDLFHHSG